MPRLELEITDKMMEKLEKRAETYAVEPSDIAKSILAGELARSAKPCWMDRLATITTKISDAVVAASKMEAQQSDQQ